MTQDIWTDIDEYFENLLIPMDEAADFDMVLAESKKAGLPPMAVSAMLGKFLYMMVQVQGARRVLEVGTLGGYSTLWLARALPENGVVVSIDHMIEHVQAAQANMERAGVADKVDIRCGKALDVLHELEAEQNEDGTAPFDMIFLDAEKREYPEYFTHALNLSRPGTVIIADNVVRAGRAGSAHADSADPVIHGIRTFNDMVAHEPRVTATALQTVGVKGHDGFMLIRVQA